MKIRDVMKLLEPEVGSLSGSVDVIVSSATTDVGRCISRAPIPNPMRSGPLHPVTSDCLPAEGIDGFFPDLPDSMYADDLKRYGARDPTYAGCVVNPDEEPRLRAAAHEYATKYDREIVENVRR